VLDKDRVSQGIPCIVFVDDFESVHFRISGLLAGLRHRSGKQFDTFSFVISSLNHDQVFWA
jgi:hypothetical protein